MNPKTNTQSRSAGLEEKRSRTRKAKPQERMAGKVGGRKPKLCSVDGCNRELRARGYCYAHYDRVRKFGDAMIHLPITRSRFGERNSKWRGGIVDDGHGRTLIYSPGHPHPSYCGTHVYRYRLVMEKHLGRFLSPNEIVHHKNGDHSDDRLENLEVMSQSEHCLLHFYPHIHEEKYNKHQ